MEKQFKLSSMWIIIAFVLLSVTAFSADSFADGYDVRDKRGTMRLIRQSSASGYCEQYAYDRYERIASVRWDVDGTKLNLAVEVELLPDNGECGTDDNIPCWFDSYETEEYVKVWADWNEDGQFENGGSCGEKGDECIMVRSLPVSSHIMQDDRIVMTFGHTADIPDGHAGDRQMRVSLSLGLPPDEPCGPMGWGDVWDEKIKLTHRLTGQVTDISDNPVSGADVEVWSDSVGFRGRTVTDASGRYEIGGLPSARDYTITVSARPDSPYMSFRQDDVSVEDDTARKIMLHRGTSTTKGHVYDSEGAPVVRAFVMAYSFSSGASGYAWSDNEGFYQITGMADASDYSMAASHPSSDEYALHRKTDIVAGDTVDFILRPRGFITGYVKDKYGAISGWAVAEISSEAANMETTATPVNDDGYYSILLKPRDQEGNLIDDYVVTISSKNYLLQTRSGISVGDEVNFTLVTEPINEISGTVRDSEGKTPPDRFAILIRAFVKDRWGCVGRVLTSEDDGSFKITGLTDTEKYQLWFDVHNTGLIQWAGENDIGVDERADAKAYDTGTTVNFRFDRSWDEINHAPTDIILSSDSVDENSPCGTEVGTLSSIDEDGGDTHTYRLIWGLGDADNDFFYIDENILKTNAVFDYEVKNEYDIRIRSTDSEGGEYEEQFVIKVNNASEPNTTNFRVWIDKNYSGPYDPGEGVEGAHVFVTTDKEDKGSLTAEGSGGIIPLNVSEDDKIYAYKQFYSEEVLGGRAHDILYSGNRSENPYFALNETGGPDCIRYDFVMASDFLYDNGEYHDFPGDGESLRNAQRDCGGNLLIQLVHPKFEWNLVVAFQSDPANTPGLYASVKDGLRTAADYIYNYTDGYSTIKNIVLVEGAHTVYWKYCDVRIHDDIWPQASVDGYKYANGHIDMDKDFPGSPDGALWFRVLGHEAGHYLFGFFDEYINGNDDHEWTYRQDHSEEFPVNYGLMDALSNVTEMSGIRDYFVHPAPYDPAQVTAQLYAREKNCWFYFRTQFQDKVRNKMSGQGFSEAFFSNLIIPPHEEGSYPRFDNRKRPGPETMNHNEVNIIEWAPPNPKRSAREPGEFFQTALQVVDQAGIPVPEVGVWHISDDRKNLRGKTDSEGFIKFAAKVGDSLEVYFAGRKAELCLSEAKSVWSLTIPLDSAEPPDAPGIIVSAKPDSSDPKRILVAVSGDSLTSVSEATLVHSSDGTDIPMADSGNGIWTGTADYNDTSGLLEIVAASETGSSQSVNPFEIQDINMEIRQTYRSWRNQFIVRFPFSFTGSGRIVFVSSTAPPPANGDLAQVGYVWSIGFSDETDKPERLSIEIYLGWDRLEGLDVRALHLYGWNTEDRMWNLISGGGTDLNRKKFYISLDSMDHTSYAMFAPLSSDTIPPDPITDFQAKTGTSRQAIDLQWTEPYDNEGIYTYDIRVSEVPFTVSEWDNYIGIGRPPSPVGAGVVQRISPEMEKPDRDYYFGIQAVDAAGNRSPVTFLTTPTRSHMYDSDKDGMWDRWETSNGLDPNRNDALDDNDGDGLTNILEYQHDTSPRNPDSDGDGCSDTEELSLGSDPLERASHPLSAVIRVADESDSPVAGAEVWLVSDEKRIFQGRTDKQGLTESLIGVGRCLEAYLDGRKASLDIDGVWDENAIVLPSQSDVPGIIVSAKPDDSYWSHITVMISGDSPVSEPEVAISQFYNYSHDVSMTSANDHLWTGNRQCKYDRGVIEVAAASESGSNLSVSPFEIYYNSESRYQCMNGELEMVLYQGGGTFMVTQSSAPAPPNGDLVQVGYAWGLGFSDHLGTDFEITLDIRLREEQLEGLAISQMNLWGWNAEGRTWELIPGGENDGFDFFETHVGFPRHISYALFAPPSDDTTPPDPATDFQVRTCDTPGCIVLQWTAPADNHAVYRYDIRYIRTVPLTESNWHECDALAPLDLPEEPGTVQTVTLDMTEGKSYYFGIRSSDTSGNWSPITVPDAPTRTFMIETDGDGMDDDWETWRGLDPTTDDSQNDDDGDGLTNIQEYDYSTDPKKADTDEDGWSDSDELRLGTDPRKSYSHPYMSGDLNCDARVDLADAIIALQVQVSDAVALLQRRRRRRQGHCYRSNSYLSGYFRQINRKEPVRICMGLLRNILRYKHSSAQAEARETGERNYFAISYRH